MRRGLSAWCVAAPLAIVGSQAAHALDYRIVAPDPEEREHLLRETGHAYMAHLPLALGLLTVAIVSAFVAEAMRGRARPAARVSAWFGLVAPGVFAAQELFERLAHDGSVSPAALIEPTFVVGLMLQLPFALLAILAAWLLLRAARAVGRLLARPVGLRRVPVATSTASDVSVPRISALAFGCGTRGPPLPSP